MMFRMHAPTRSLASPAASVAAVVLLAGCGSWHLDPDPEPIPKEQEWMYRPVGTGVAGIDPSVPDYNESCRRRHSDSHH